jgi:hypothetical protein
MPDDPDEPDPTIPPPLETATTDDLRDAVGVPRRGEPVVEAAPVETSGAAVIVKPMQKAKPKPRDDDHDDDRDDADVDEDGKRKRRRTGLIVAIALIVGGAIATLVLVGSSNHGRFVFRCGPNKITAERGRSFPPWGTDRLGGAAWKPIEIPPDTECRSTETESQPALEGLFLDALVAQAELRLGSKEVTDLDKAQAVLDQALLLARDPDRVDQRKKIDRMVGDVEYWRGAERVKAAIQTLEDAGKKFDTAVDKRPRYASDAAAWAAWARQVASSLRAGPGGTPESGPAPTPERPTRPDVPTGIALPVEESPGEDAGVAPVTPVDAGVPRGGVLL